MSVCIIDAKHFKRRMPEENRKIKVAVLGGGCGAMSAAFYLTSTPELRARYEVTVYQQGWRLVARALLAAIVSAVIASWNTACTSGSGFTTTPST